MRLVYKIIRGEFQKEYNRLQKPIAAAARSAVREASSLVKKESAIALAAAGLKRDRRAMRSRILPKKVESINSVAEFWLRPAYLGVFEDGASISGKPLLWLPLDGVPVGDRGRKLTPKQYTERIGPLHSVRGSSRPLLVGRGTTGTISRATSKFVRFRKKAVAAGKLQGSTNVPLYVGVSAINIARRMNLTAIVKRISDRLGELYLKAMKKIDG